MFAIGVAVTVPGGKIMIFFYLSDVVETIHIWTENFKED